MPLPPQLGVSCRPISQPKKGIYGSVHPGAVVFTKRTKQIPGTPNITKFFQLSLSRHFLVDEFLSSITITYYNLIYIHIQVYIISYINMLQYSLISVAYFLHHGTGDRDGLLKLGRRVAPHSQLQHGLGGERAFLSNASGITTGI